MRRGVGAALALAVLGGLLARAPAAWACSCDAPGTRAQVRAADAVFVGVALRVVAVERDAPTTERDATATFAVDEVYKGAVPPVALVRTEGIGGGCGVEFVEGERYAVFTDAFRGSMRADICNGTTDDEGVLGRALLRPTARYDAGDRAALLAPESHRSGRAGPIAAGVLLLGVALAGIWFARRARRGEGAASLPLG